MLMTKSHECATLNAQLAFIKLKRAIYGKFGEFSESDMEHLHEQASQKQVTEDKDKNAKMFLHETQYALSTPVALSIWCQVILLFSVKQ